MANTSDILLQMIQEQWDQARQSENQRSVISNFIIIVASAITGFLVKTDPGRTAIPLTVLLMALGLFGILICAKLYERFYLHVQRVGRMIERLDELHPNAEIHNLEQKADIIHRERFPVMSRIRLHHLWMTIHTAIALIGLVSTVLLLVRGSLFGDSPANVVSG